MKYVAYCRKSQEREDRQILSITSQVKEVTEIATRQKLNLAKVLKEEQSAKKPGRPVLNEMIEEVRKGKYEGILCWKLDRLARNAADGGAIIQLFDDGLIKEIITPSKIYQNKGDDKFWMQIEFGMAKKFVDDLSDNTKRGLRQTLSEGRAIGPAPRGYINIDEEGRIAGRRYDKNKQRKLDDLGRPLKRIEIDPIEGSLVKELFEYSATGDKTLQSISDKAYELGLTSKTGNKLAIEAIRHMLNNTFYYGVITAKGEQYKGTYEPLIGKELFDKSRVCLQDKTKPINLTWNHAYRGLIKCSECGCSITATTKVKAYKQTGRTVEYVYYHCTKRKGDCKNKWITKEELESQIEKKINAIEIKDAVLEAILDIAKEQHKNHLDLEVYSRASLQKELNLVDKKLERLLDLRINEELTEEEYKAKKIVLVDRKTSLIEKLDESSLTADNWLERVEQFFRTCNIATHVFKNGNLEEKRNLVKSLGWNLFLEDKKLIWNYQKPFDILVKPIQQSSNVKSKQELKKIWLLG